MEIDFEKLKHDFKAEFLEVNECEMGDTVKTDCYTIIGILIGALDKQQKDS